MPERRIVSLRVLPCLLGVAACLLGPRLSASGPWMRSEGEYLYSTSLDWSNPQSYFDLDGRTRKMDSEFSSVYQSHTLEYGASYYHTLFGTLPLVAKRYGETRTFGAGDLRLGVRGRLDVFRNGRTWEAVLILPTGYDSNSAARLGYGRVGLEVGAYARFSGKEADQPTTSTLEMGGAVRVWQGAPSNQLKTYLKAGRPLGTFRATFALDAELAIGRKPLTEPTIQTQSQPGAFDKLAAELTLQKTWLRGWTSHIQLSQTVWGRNTAKGLGVGFGVSRTWR